MIIGPDRWRKPLLLLWLIIFLIIAFNIIFPMPVFSIIDNLAFSFQSQLLPHWLLLISTPFSWFATGFGNALLILALVFLLWGFKYKIPATWLLFTNISGWLLISILSLFLHHQVSGGQTVFPNKAIFLSTLLLAYLFNIILPEIKRIRYQLLFQLVCLIFFALILVNQLGTNNAVPSDLLGGWILALIWLTYTEIYYVKYAKEFRRRVIFRNSWY